VYSDKLFDSIAEGGDFQAFGSADDLRAYIGWYHRDVDPAFGCPITRVFADHRLDDDQARDWLLQQVQQLAPTLGNDADLMVDPCYPSIARAWLDAGFRISSVMLVGRTELALQRLMQHKNPTPDLTHLGLTMRQAQPEDVDELVELRRVVFAAEPEWCWFGAGPGALEHFRERFLNAPADRGGVTEVIMDGDRIVGTCDADWSVNPMWGSLGGFGLIFRRSIRGQGVAKTAYRRMLQNLVDHDIPLFRGSTAQPAVMGLAALMERRLSGWTLRRDEYFEAGHWGQLNP